MRTLGCVLTDISLPVEETLGEENSEEETLGIIRDDLGLALRNGGDNLKVRLERVVEKDSTTSLYVFISIGRNDAPGFPKGIVPQKSLKVVSYSLRYGNKFVSNGNKSHQIVTAYGPLLPFPYQYLHSTCLLLI